MERFFFLSVWDWEEVSDDLDAIQTSCCDQGVEASWDPNPGRRNCICDLGRGLAAVVWMESRRGRERMRPSESEAKYHVFKEFQTM